MFNAARSTLTSQVSSRLAPSATRTMSTTTSSPSPSGTWRNTLHASIRYGPNSLSTALPAVFDEDLALLNPRPFRALIITGKSLSTKTDVIERVRSALGNRYVATFDKISQHAPVEAIHEAVDIVKREKIDALVSVGGGSPIDAAKAVAYLVHQERHGEEDNDPRNYLPSIAIPTTLSAAECTQNAGITREGKKTGFSHPALVPRAIILDATLAMHTPLRLWLSSGMRAVDHGIECLYRPGDVQWLLRGQYLAALRDLFALLRRSKERPEDVDVRQKLQLAAIVSLFPESRKGALGLSHGFGHALGSTYGIPHGITSCLTLAPSIRHVVKHSTPDRLASLADALPFISSTPTPLAPIPDGNENVEQLRAQGNKVADEVDRLVADLGLTSTLAEYKVPKGDLRGIAEHAAGPKGKDDQGLVEELLKLLESIDAPKAKA